MTLSEQRSLVGYLRRRSAHWRYRAQLDESMADALETHVGLVDEGLLGVREVEELAEELWAVAKPERTPVPD